MLTAPEPLGGQAADLLHDQRSHLHLSAASSWEIAIKYAIGRLPLPEPPEVYVPQRIRATRVESLPVTHAHALRVAALPRHHTDPFDRLLIAQAQLEALTIVTLAAAFPDYDVPVIAAA